MGHAMYFSLGNSNSLASVDISAGYVGLEDFVPSIMVPLTYVSTYCGPCLWLMAGILSVIRNTRNAVRCVQVYLHLIFMIYFISNTTQDGTITFTISKRNFCIFQLCFERQDLLYQWRGAPFKTLLPSYLMSFWQILETVAISKHTVGKLMPIYQITL